MNESYITVCGNVTNVPSVRHGNDSGVPFTVFGLAQNRSRREPNGEITHTGTSFYEVIAFRALGHNVLDSIGMGEPVIVHGRMRVNDWQSGDKKGTQVQIDAISVGPDLTFGTSQFTKRRKAQQQSHDRIDLEVGGMPMSVNGDGEVFDAPDPDDSDLGAPDFGGDQRTSTSSALDGSDGKAEEFDDSEGSRVAS